MDKDKSKNQDFQGYEKKDIGTRKFFSKISQRGTGANILGIVIGILLIAAFMSMLTGGQPKTFASLLETIQNCPSLSLNWLTTRFDKFVELLRPDKDWGVLNFIRDIIIDWVDLFDGLWSFLFFLSKGLVNFMIMLTYLSRWLFL